MGRPTKLTPDLQERFCVMLSKGVHPETACECVGISYRAYYDWLKRGQAAAEADEPDPEDVGFIEFWRQATAALGKVNGEIEENIMKASKTDWRAGAFLLAKRKPRLYSDKTSVEINDKRGAGTLTAEAAAEIRRKILYGNHVPRKGGGDHE